MNILKHLLVLSALALFISCAKNAPDLINLAQSNLDQNRENDAIENLNTLLDKYPNDSLASLAQYKLASIYKNWKNDPSNFIKSLEKTVNNYPNSLHAKQAKKEIASFQDWIINNAETLRKRKLTSESINNLIYLVENFPQHELAPKAQYIVGDIYMNDLRDFEKALSEYRVVLSNYDGSKEEALAQFMIGYIYANVLKDFVAARKEYQIFLDSFPNHELHPSVKFEIEYLGKDINEIPALKHITS
jgi:outer membrane protein assembly factor BamD (BamD/ComL family)